MRNYATSIAKACSSIVSTKQPSRAYSATSDFVSNRHPISIKTPGLNNEERHLVLVANSTWLSWNWQCNFTENFIIY